jgi:hypothetical protein
LTKETPQADAVLTDAVLIDGFTPPASSWVPACAGMTARDDGFCVNQVTSPMMRHTLTTRSAFDTNFEHALILSEEMARREVLRLRLFLAGKSLWPLHLGNVSATSPVNGSAITQQSAHPGSFAAAYDLIRKFAQP